MNKMGVPLGSCNRGLSPICIPYTEFQPNVIECPGITNTYVESPLCDFLPVITSLPDFLINLPFLLLFVVSLPARFLYCMAYTYLVNADQFYQLLIYYLIYPFIDFVTLPFLYFVLGFSNGLIDQFNLPNQLYGFVNACFVSSILEEAYKILGDVFYVIGFALGFLSAIFYKLYNLFIDLACYVAYLTITFGVGFCINLGVTQPSTCVKVSVQPFAFLQNLVCTFLNCDCALGSSPTIFIGIPISLGCSSPPCNGENIIPPCMLENLTNTVYQSMSNYNLSSEMYLSEMYSSANENIYVEYSDVTVYSSSSE